MNIHIFFCDLNCFSAAQFICVLDIDEGRLNKAKELGADYIIKVDPTKDSRHLAKEVVDSLGPADQTIECSGAESSFHAAIHVSSMASIFNYVLTV